jgi:G3E family GTPase
LRLAIVSNEFGELGIYRALLGGGDETLVELGGGCVCCQLSDELVVTLDRLRERVDPDRIVIETSGVALPYDVQLHLFREPVSRWLGDDVTVVVVNAEQVARGRDLEGTFEDQVSSADLLLLNKIDLVPEAGFPRLEARLARSSPGADPAHPSRRGVAELLFPPGRRRAGAAARGRRGVHTHEAFSRVLEVEPGLPIRHHPASDRGEGALRARASSRPTRGCACRAWRADRDRARGRAAAARARRRVVVIRRRRDTRG